MAAMDVNGIASVDVNGAGDVVLTVLFERQLLSTSSALKLADTLTKAAKVAEAAYAAQVRQAKLEAEIVKLQAKLAEKMAALG